MRRIEKSSLQIHKTDQGKKNSTIQGDLYKKVGPQKNVQRYHLPKPELSSSDSWSNPIGLHTECQLS